MMNKKLLATLVAATFAAPAAVYAQDDDGATLYGRLHVGLQVDDDKTAIRSGGSRFGVFDRTDVGNGRSVFYRFEFDVNELDDNNANKPTVANRRAFVGLGGSFGDISFGRQSTAMDTHMYGFMDPSWALGSGGGITGRLSNDLKYAVSIGPVNIATDLIFDGDNTASDGLDRFQIAGSGKVGAFSFGLGFEQTAEATGAITARAQSAGYTHLASDAPNFVPNYTAALMALRDADTMAMTADTAAAAAANAADATAADDAAAAADAPTNTALQTAATAARAAATAARETANTAKTTADREAEHLAEFIAAGSNTVTGAERAAAPAYDSTQIGIGLGVDIGDNYAIKGGYVVNKSDDDATNDEKTTVLALSGAFDNGMSGYIQLGKHENTSGVENDYIIGQILTTGFGGGTTVYAEVRNDDEPDETKFVLGLIKNF